MTLILASTSPRRRELLTQLLFASTIKHFEIVAPDIDESYQPQESAAAVVERLAREKAQAGFNLCQDFPQPLVIGADTIVVIDDKILGKPSNIQDARSMLQMLSAKQHTVMTAVAVANKHKTLSCLVKTSVTFCELTPAYINSYIATGEPMDKAGSYGIQGLGGTFVTAINGSYSSVVGLPFTQTRQLLQEFTAL